MNFALELTVKHFIPAAIIGLTWYLGMMMTFGWDDIDSIYGIMSFAACGILTYVSLRGPYKAYKRRQEQHHG